MTYRVVFYYFKNKYIDVSDIRYTNRICRWWYI